MNNTKKLSLILILLVALYAILPVSTTAQQSTLATFEPSTGPLKTAEEKAVKFTLNSTEGISAFDLNFETSGGLSITGFSDTLLSDNNFDPFKSKNLKSEVSNSNSRIAYSFNAPSPQLPKRIDIFIKVQGSATGEGRITLNYNNSQILSGNNALLQIAPNQFASYNLNTSESSPNFTDPATLPPQIYPQNTAVVNLKLKLYGAQNIPQNQIKGTAVAVGRVGESKFETAPHSFALNPNPDGTFQGTVAFPDFRDGNKFSLMIKVDKYLLRRICNADANESKLGGYICTDPDLTILRGNNSFDFTGISLIPGDLARIDGLLNGYDLSILRNNIGKNTSEAVALADLNYDGIVDTKDYEIIKFAALNTKMKGDQ